MGQPTIKDLIRGCGALETDKQGNTTSARKTGFLHLPGELRNVIYELVAEGLVATASPTTTGTPRICKYRSSYGKVRDYSTAPHPLTQTCRLVRSEFSSFLRGETYPLYTRQARVVDYNFRPLLEHLRRHPPLRTPCRLEIQVQFTRTKYEDWASLKEWFMMCQPLPIGPQPMEAVHVIHGSAYDVSFVAQPGSFHGREEVPGHTIALTCAMRNMAETGVLSLEKITPMLNEWSYRSQFGSCRTGGLTTLADYLGEVNRSSTIGAY